MKRNLHNAKVARFRAKQQAAGWLYICLILPPEVKAKVMDYKRTLMAEYLANQNRQ
jgi:hypothetical protein